MRNKKLLSLQEKAEAAFKAAETAFQTLTSYLHHLDARETDTNYAHARIGYLFKDCKCKQIL